MEIDEIEMEIKDFTSHELKKQDSLANLKKSRNSPLDDKISIQAFPSNKMV